MIIKPTTPKIYTPQDKSCVLNLDARDVRGDKIYDRSGKGNHGAITGAVIKPANYGLPVLSFDGVDDFINCGNDASLNIVNAITTIFIVKPSTIVNIQDLYHYGYTGATFKGMFVQLNNTGKIRVKIGNGILFEEVISNKSYNTEWQYLVITYDGTTIKVFRNGIQDINTATLAGPLVNDTSVLANICRASWGGYHFGGKISYIKVLNKILSPSEISKNFSILRHIYGI